MINRLIDVALKNRFIVIALYLGLAGWGWWAVGATPIDAIPDLSDNQVIVFTDWSGHGPQEVEDQITYPLTTNLQGLAGVRVVRSQSAFGFSMVYVIFEDDIDLYFARSRVLERMSLVTKALPAGVESDRSGPDRGPAPPSRAPRRSAWSRASWSAARNRSASRPTGSDSSRG